MRTSGLQHLIQNPVIRLIDLLQIEVAVGFFDGGQVAVVQLGIATEGVAVGASRDESGGTAGAFSSSEPAPGGTSASLTVSS